MARVRSGTAGVALAISLAGCPSQREEGGAPAVTDAALAAVTRETPAASSDAGIAPRRFDRLYVVASSIDVMASASARAAVVGTVRAGGSVEIASNRPSSDQECAEGWQPVVPRGFVCAGNRATREADSPQVGVLSEYRLAEHAALPATYGVSEVAPIYMRLPTWDEQLRSEPGLEEHLHKRAHLREARDAARAWGDTSEARDTDLYPAGTELPDPLRSGAFVPLAPRALVPSSPVTGFVGQGARVAWIAEFDATGRTWLLTPELLLVPRDKVKRSVVSGFHGIEVPRGSFAAFVGRRPARRFRRDGANGFTREQEDFAPASALLSPGVGVGVTGYVESSAPGVFFRADEVILARPTLPDRWGLGGDGGSAGDRWIEVDVKNQVLFLHEGAATSFATLVSAGMETRRGTFRVVAKHLTLAAPFQRPRPSVGAAEVPEVLFLAESADGPLASALFAGWWMNSWGVPNGGFGIALAPLDARRVFDFVSPELPEGWHSVRAEGTAVVVHD